MAFSRSRSLLHEFTPLFRLLEHHKAIHPARIAARFVPAAACSTAHTTGRVTKLSDHHHHHHHGVHPWRRRHWWGWGWGWDPAAADWNMGTHGVRPDIDMVEKGDAYVIEADLPGVKKGDVNVRVGDGGWSLSVEGRRGATTGSSEKTEDGQKETGEAEHVDAMISERAETFARKIWFSQAIDGRGVKAKFEDGVLRLHVPKKVEEDGSFKVDVV